MTSITRDAGLNALLASGALSGVTSLSLRDAGLGPDGARALEFGEVVWMTRAGAVSKARAGLQNPVTFAEMCQWKDLGKKFPQ